jgi:hypothetical protein
MQQSPCGDKIRVSLGHEYILNKQNIETDTSIVGIASYSSSHIGLTEAKPVVEPFHTRAIAFPQSNGYRPVMSVWSTLIWFAKHRRHVFHSRDAEAADLDVPTQLLPAPHSCHTLESGIKWRSHRCTMYSQQP